jgi:HK97 gp10 family phage protein|nr:MAG TPA: putative tail component [Bacteriophage sp.]
MSMEIKGLDSLRRKLQSLGGDLEQATEKGVEKATKTVQTAAKLLCPVDTGYLRESIQTSFAWQPSGEYVGTVGTIVEYAPYVEFGTGQMGAASPSPPKAPLSLGYREDWKGQFAQPYLYPALINNRDRIVKHLEIELRKGIREAMK